MTVRELSQLYYLKLEVKRDKRELARVDGWISKAPSSFIPGLVELHDLLASHLEKHSRERDRLERFIADIPDSYTRQMFIMRYAEGKSWMQIALKIGYYASEDCVRKSVYRYLARTEQAATTGH